MFISLQVLFLRYQSRWCLQVQSVHRLFFSGALSNLKPLAKDSNFPRFRCTTTHDYTRPFPHFPVARPHPVGVLSHRAPAASSLCGTKRAGGEVSAPANMIMGYGKMLVLGWMNMAYLGNIVLADNEAIEEPDCDGSASVSIRYSATSARLYIESPDGYQGGGCVTLGQIFEARGGKAPLYAVDPSTDERFENATGTWLLTESLYVEDGITLNVSPTSLGITFVFKLHTLRMLLAFMWALFVDAQRSERQPAAVAVVVLF